MADHRAINRRIRYPPRPSEYLPDLLPDRYSPCPATWSSFDSSVAESLSAPRKAVSQALIPHPDFYRNSHTFREKFHPDFHGDSYHDSQPNSHPNSSAHPNTPIDSNSNSNFLDNPSPDDRRIKHTPLKSNERYDLVNQLLSPNGIDTGVNYPSSPTRRVRYTAEDRGEYLGLMNRAGLMRGDCDYGEKRRRMLVKNSDGEDDGEDDGYHGGDAGVEDGYVDLGTKTGLQGEDIAQGVDTAQDLDIAQGVDALQVLDTDSYTIISDPFSDTEAIFTEDPTMATPKKTSSWWLARVVNRALAKVADVLYDKVEVGQSAEKGLIVCVKDKKKKGAWFVRKFGGL